MLNPDEQAEVMKAANQLHKTLQTLRQRQRSGSISGQARAMGILKARAKLQELLKEIG